MTTVRRVEPTGRQLDGYLLVVFRPWLTLGMFAGYPPNELVVAGKSFRPRVWGKGDSVLGTYDWLRTDSGRLLGLRLETFLTYVDQLDSLRSAAGSLDYVEFPYPGDVEVVIDRSELYDPYTSCCQAFGESVIWAADDGEHAMTVCLMWFFESDLAALQRSDADWVAKPQVQLRDR